MDHVEQVNLNEYEIVMRWIIDVEALRYAADHSTDLQSKRFKTSIPGVKYYLALHPNGNNEERRGQVWMIFVVENSNKKLMAEWTISTASYERSLECMFESNKGIGHKMFSRNDLFNPEKKFIVDGLMTIELHGTLTAVDWIHSPVIEFRNIGVLLSEREDKDFIVAVGEDEVKVHKWLLEARSPVFVAMMASNRKEAMESRLEIIDFPFEVVKSAIDFLYDKDIASCVTEANVTDFLKFADKYDIQYFQTWIEYFLIGKANASNVCKLANATMDTNAKTLQEYCVCYIVNAIKQSIPLTYADEICGEIKLLVCDRMLLHSSTIVL